MKNKRRRKIDTDHSMSPVQEWANAWSMVLPTLLCVYFILSPPHPNFWHRHTKLMAAGTFLHLPFSFTYHCLCALRAFPDPVNCTWRRLDQSFIHVVCIFYSYALSGSELYGLGNALLNSWYVIRLWISGSHDNAFERRSNIAMAVMMYTLPMLFRGDLINYIAAVPGCWGVSAALFAGNKWFGGWGHTVSHVGMLGYQFFLLRSASHVI